MEQLERDLFEGVIDQREFNRLARDMERAYRAEAEEAAEEAYRREMERW
jgi:hypothetical protein